MTGYIIGGKNKKQGKQLAERVDQLETEILLLKAEMETKASKRAPRKKQD